MLRVNLSDGTTISFDLEDDAGLERWRHVQADRSFQAEIKAVQVAVEVHYEVVVDEGLYEDEIETDMIRDKVVHTLIRPTGMRPVSFEAFLVYDDRTAQVAREVVRCYVDDVCITLTVYRRRIPPAMAVVDISRPGRRVLMPPGVGRSQSG